MLNGLTHDVRIVLHRGTIEELYIQYFSTIKMKIMFYGAYSLTRIQEVVNDEISHKQRCHANRMLVSVSETEQNLAYNLGQSQIDLALLHN